MWISKFEVLHRGKIKIAGQDSGYPKVEDWRKMQDEELRDVSSSQTMRNLKLQNAVYRQYVWLCVLRQLKGWAVASFTLRPTHRRHNLSASECMEVTSKTPSFRSDVAGLHKNGEMEMVI